MLSAQKKLIFLQPEQIFSSLVGWNVFPTAMLCFGGAGASLGPRWAHLLLLGRQVHETSIHPGVTLFVQTAFLQAAASLQAAFPRFWCVNGVLWELQVNQRGKWGSLTPGTVQSLNCFVMKHFCLSEQSCFDVTYSTSVGQLEKKKRVISIFQCSKLNVEYWHFAQDWNFFSCLDKRPGLDDKVFVV